MANTTAPATTPTWLTALLAFAPSLNQILIVACTAAFTLGATWVTQNWTRTRATPVAVVKSVPVQSVPAVGPSRLDTLEQRLSALEGQIADLSKTTARRGK